jgi:hypothetical protein
MNEKERTLMEVEHRKGGQIVPKQKVITQIPVKYA